MTEPSPQHRRLILMRHAKSAWDDPALTDHARPLNARGRRSAEALGAWLRRRGYRPEEALVSDAQRTRDTFAGLALPLTARFEPRLYHAEPPQLLARLREAKAPCVLLIAHNPGIGHFAASLLGRRPQHPRFADYPTGATLVADFPITAWHQLDPGTGQPLDFIVPRDLTD